MACLRAFRNCLCLGTLLALLSGCAEKWHPVEGTVMIEGKPLGQAAVMFVPKAGGTPSTGSTDANGKFRLDTNNNAGVKPGEYIVVISKTKQHGVLADGSVGPKGTWYEWFTPERYSKPETSGLTATVPQASYEFNMTAK